MKTEVLLFGRLTELTGQKRMTLEGMVDTDAVCNFLHHAYPSLQFADYHIAVNQQTIQTNKMLADGMTVAFLPPFSGG